MIFQGINKVLQTARGQVTGLGLMVIDKEQGFRFYGFGLGLESM